MATRKKKGTVGIVGLGIMGGAFARNLAAAGWRVVGFDISAARRREAARAGVEIATDAADVAAKVPVVITSLPTPKALDFTAKKIAAAKLPRRTIVEASTFTIEDKQRAAAVLEKAGHSVLDTPVSGTGAQAKKKDLIFYASGNSAAIKKLRPMFRDFGREVYDLGRFGNGSRMKYVANLLVAIHNVAAAEAMVLGIKGGLDPEIVYKLANAGAGQSRMFDLRGPMMVKDRYDDVTMKVSVWQKDMSVIGHFAKQIGVKVPLFTASEPIYSRAIALGHGEHDTASVCAVIENMAHFKRRKTRAR
ncbi:MAG TPA: NAD(P)-dependent oxidoreductase [Pseudolabrys sp.]|nr:NAD(P)-dependent oxidoreductase [Pseudolabrys sp.]